MELTRRSLLVLGATSVGALACSKGGDVVPSCPKVPLSPQAEQLRLSLKYVERSQDPQKFCSGCTQYKPAVGSGCGGCSLFEGPIHPEGSCAAFAPRA